MRLISFSVCKQIAAALIIVLINDYMARAQTIVIDSTFTNDAIIEPFGPNDTLYSLKISGSLTLNSDTSLVRVVVGNEDSLEYMVYESYPLISAEYSYSFSDESDETSYLNTFLPKYLKVYLINATLSIDSLCDISNFQENLDSLQFDSKMIAEILKVQIMQERIEDFGMFWFCQSYTSAVMYHEKSSLYGSKYNLLGWDYYSGGVFEFLSKLDSRSIDNSSFVKNFNWKEKHNAHLTNSFYHDGNPDSYLYTCKPPSYYINEIGNGWMTSVKDQDVCGQSNCNSACYIFAVLGAVEAVSNLFYNYHYDVNLSEQQGLDCDAWGNGCGGGSPQGISVIARTDGFVNEDCYPWADNENTCREPDYCNGPDPEYQIKVSDWDRVDISNTNIIKEAIINYGPLQSTINMTTYWGTTLHCMVLCGYQVIQEGDIFYSGSGDSLVIEAGDNIIGSLTWIFKNSYSPHSDIKGYISISHRPDLFYEKLGYSYTYYYVSPVTDVIGNNNYETHCYDEDNDGYYNWGLCDYADKTECGCESSDPGEEDSNDNDKRLGPYDDNYNGKPVKPEMMVQHLEGFVYNNVYNEGFLILDNLSLPSTLSLKVVNSGNAQLNFEPAALFPPPDFAKVLISGPDADAFIYNDNLALSVEMNGGEESFSISYDGNCTGSAKCFVTIHMDEFDMEDYTFAIVYADCNKTPSNIIISGAQTWSDWMVITDNYKVEHGGKLTITGHVGFSNQVDFIVNEGGEVIIDGGQLTNACSSFWKGIDIWGDDEKSQYNGDQGKVLLKNGGIIKHAICGIETGKEVPGYYIPSGGIVQSNGGVFEDNIRGVRFHPYHNFNPQTGDPANNLSKFKNTEFIITQDLYNLDEEPEACIDLNWVKGILFKGNTFKNIANTTNGEYRGIGIKSATAGFYVQNLCVSQTTPCSEYIISKFEHLDYGIKVLGERESLPIMIDSAIFIDNLRGILMSGVNDVEIIKNQFEINIDNSYYGEEEMIGVYLEACRNYMLEENDFKGHDGLQTPIGIHILNSGPHYNEVYNNSLENLYHGVVAVGENRNMVYDGLCIKCNDFNYCNNDIVVIPELDNDLNPIINANTGVAIDQGNGESGGLDNTLAAGNTFSIYNSTNPNYINEVGCNHIDYIYHGQNQTGKKLSPIPIEGDIQPESDPLAEYTKIGACPSNLGSGIDIQVEMNSLVSELVIISAYEDTLTTNIDGGNTDGLNLEVQTSFPNEALQVRQELLAESPYLSDTVMKTAIFKETVLPNAMIRDVLVANPQSAKSAELLKDLDNRFDPMPDYMMVEIMQGQNFYGAKELLERNLSKHKSNRSESLMKLIRFYKSDTLNIPSSTDSLISILQAESDADSHYQLGMLYLNNKDSLNAFLTLSNIPVEFDLSQQEQNIHDLYADIFDILWHITSDTIPIDSLQIQTLIDVSDNYRSLPGLYARNILINKGVISYYEPVYLASSLKTSTTWENSTEKYEYDTRLHVFPNPARDYFIAYYNLMEGVEQSLLSVSGINGKIIHVQELKGEENQVVIPMNGYPSGIYVVNLYSKNVLLESTKVVISK